MKVTNIKKLWIKFIGGGLIKFPHENLREVDIDGDSDEQSDGGNDSLVDSAVSTYNEQKNYGSLYTLDLEEYNQGYKEYSTEEYGNGNNVIVFTNDNNDEQIAFKFSDDEFAEFMHKIAIFNDWRNSFISFPINMIIDIYNDGKQMFTNYDSHSFGDFGGAILGYRDDIALGLTGKENFIKLNSIVDVGNMFFRNDSWIYRRTQQFNLNDYNFNQVFDSTFDIYKLKCGDSNNMEFGLIKIVNKEDNNQIMFTTYNIYNGPGK